MRFVSACWNAGDIALINNALQFQSIASTQVADDYQVQINFLDNAHNADESTVTESFTINWAGHPLTTIIHKK